MKQLRWIVIVLCGFGLVMPEVRAQDCCCTGPGRQFGQRFSWYASAWDEYLHSDAVFVGEFVKAWSEPFPEDPDSPRVYRVRIKVNKAWKRDFGSEVDLWMSEDCRIPFVTQDSYIIYAYPDPYKVPNRLWVRFCSSTRLLDEASDDLEEFNRRGAVVVRNN